MKIKTQLMAGVLALALGSPALAYEEIAVSEGGTLKGTVTLEGTVPKPKGYNLTTLPDPFYCGRISDGQGWRILQPFNIGPAGEFREVVVYLEGIEKGKPFLEKTVPQIEARDCLFLPFTTVVRDDQSVTVVNMDPVMHDIQAYETSNLGARVLFNVPLPMNPQHPRNFKDRTEAGMYHKHMAGPPMKELVKLSKGRRILSGIAAHDELAGRHRDHTARHVHRGHGLDFVQRRPERRLRRRFMIGERKPHGQNDHPECRGHCYAELHCSGHPCMAFSYPPSASKTRS